MYVKIGPYARDHLNAHRVVKRLREWKWLPEERDDLEDDRWDKIAWKVQSWLDWGWNNRFRKLRERKIVVRTDAYDCWSGYQTIALVALPILKDVQLYKMGFPLVDDEDVPEHLRSTAAPAMNSDRRAIGDIDDFGPKRWDWVLAEMIYAMEQYSKDDPGEDAYYDDNGQLDLEALKAWGARVNHGCMLFGKYFGNIGA